MSIVARYTREQWARTGEWEGVEPYVTHVTLLFRAEDDPDNDVEPRIIRVDPATGETWPEDAEPLPPVPFQHFRRDARTGWVLDETGDADPHAHERMYLPRPGALNKPNAVAETPVAETGMGSPVDYLALLAVATAADALRTEIAHADEDGIAFMHSAGVFADHVDRLDVVLDALQQIQETPEQLTTAEAEETQVLRMCLLARRGDPAGTLALIGRFGPVGRVLARELRA